MGVSICFIAAHIKARCHTSFIDVLSVVDISSFFWFVYMPHMDIPYKTIFKSPKIAIKN